MALVSLVGPGEPAKPTVGFRLQDHRGAWHTLDEARDRKVVVLAFLGTECPLAEAYAPRLAEVARDFGKRGVAFFGVDANQQDGPVAIGRFAEKHGLPFPILKDGSTTSTPSASIDPRPPGTTWSTPSMRSSPGGRSRRRGRTRSAAGSAGLRSRPSVAP
jgi:thiol-disulfide isomerase/thioredoxin